MTGPLLWNLSDVEFPVRLRRKIVVARSELREYRSTAARQGI